MPIRFQADADLNQVIVSGVVRCACNRLQYRDVSRSGRLEGSGSPCRRGTRWPRPGHARSGDDASTFPRVPALTAQLWPYRRPATSSGWSDDLILIWTATQAEEWTDRIAFLPI